MATALSSVEICNLAFDLLRQKAGITSIETPNSESEALAARWYDVTRRAVLRSFTWNFARKRAVLSRNAVAPAFGYADAYNLPNDYVGPVFLGDDPIEDNITDFSVEGNQVLVNNDGALSLNMCYIRDVIEVPKFDALFLDLLVAELALRFANGLTGVNKSMKGIEDYRIRLEVKARAKNGHENKPRVIRNSPLLNSRRIVYGNTSDGTHLFTQ